MSATGQHRFARMGGAWVALHLAANVQAQPTNLAPVAVILEIRGTNVQISRQADVWDLARPNQPLYDGNLVRTDERSQALLRFSELETVPLAERSTLMVRGQPGKKRGFDLLKGLLYFFHRDKPNQFDAHGPQMSAIIRGTEFTLEVVNGTSTLSVLEGEVVVSNLFDEVNLKTGEQAIVEPGQAPRKSAILEAVNVIQWRFYYPAVLDLDELGLVALEREILGASLAAYRSGDLSAALNAYPADRQPASERERVYLAALRLSFGQVKDAENLLGAITQDAGAVALADALRQLIAVVKLQPTNRPTPDLSIEKRGRGGANSPSALLAESYFFQSESHLEEALAAARKAAELAPGSGFASARVAELEFSFGRTHKASVAVEKALQLSPRNAQAHALRGFLFAAKNRINEAISAFDQAIKIDPALANGWLGRGLCLIKQGHAAEGRQDLQVAATMEPNRAVLRSFLGKAFSHNGEKTQARKELVLAKDLDPRDPTAWLYSALLNQQENRINEAVDDLEHSQELNENRRVYRSRLLLDQDAAVRGANLATIYRDAGMTDLSRREAIRAVNTDYANYSAHLFLADSYNELRDPQQTNLRYETPWLSEYLVANLLSPVGASTLSPLLSQQEYSRLFDRNRLGFSSATEYFSGGDWRQAAVQHGTYNNFSYALEGGYRSESGHRPNNDLEQITGSLLFKQQLTPGDSLFLQSTYYRAEAGDVSPYYDETKANPGLRTRETQDPLLLAGLHHQWAPGSHTLLLFGRVPDTLEVANPQQETLVLERGSTNQIVSVVPVTVDQRYRSEPELYTAEGQHIWQLGRHTLVAGARYQTTQFDTCNRYTVGNGVLPYYDPSEFVVETQCISPDFQRISGYGYYSLEVDEPLTLTVGLTYDYLTLPNNFRFAPLIEQGEESTSRLSPKAGLLWTPLTNTTFRAAYTRSLGGVAYDQSFQLEPTQVAGFNQAWRSLLPEAVTGANAGARFETFGLALDQKFPTRTYLGINAELLRSRVDRLVGVFDNRSALGQVVVPPWIFPASTPQDLDFEERALTIALNQLVGRVWAFGAHYRLANADLETNFQEIPTGTPTVPPFHFHQDLEATLHQLRLYALLNHSSGFFGQFESIWSAQSNHGYDPPRPGDEFWQFNLWVGYRLPRRQAELRAGLLNLTDRDYQLNPLNLTSELPHERTLMSSLRFNF